MLCSAAMSSGPSPARPPSSPFDLSGRVAIVTGGNGGIGLGIARGLARAGATVVLAARDASKLARAAAELAAEGAGVRTVAVDVTDEGSVKGMVAFALDAWGRVDVLVANAGVNIRKLPQEFTLAEWRLVQDANLTGTFLCAQAVYPAMKRQGGGKIVTIGSMTSLFGASFAAPYGAAKGGVMQLSKGLASAWAVDNIQVNAVLPGFIDTELTEAARAQVPGLHERVVARTPQRRWGRPDDLAGIAVFLASSASDFITGTAIPVDGGYAAQM
jgi:2-dehydro-3-deoxy-D-gluconate 5-dehydrogenase